MMDALVEDYFRYDELTQMEAKAIRHNITGSGTEILEHSKLDEVPSELISNAEIGEKENQSPDQTDNQEVVQRFRIYSDAETDAFLKENKNKNTGQKTKSDMKIVTDSFRSVGEFRDPATIPSSELESVLARFFLGERKRYFGEYEPDTLCSIRNSIDRYFRYEKLSIRYPKNYLCQSKVKCNKQQD
jgi:hypothetical protein